MRARTGSTGARLDHRRTAQARAAPTDVVERSVVVPAARDRRGFPGHGRLRAAAREGLTRGGIGRPELIVGKKINEALAVARIGVGKRGSGKCDRAGDRNEPIVVGLFIG